MRLEKLEDTTKGESMIYNIKRALKILNEILDVRAFQRGDDNIDDWNVYSHAEDRDDGIAGFISADADWETHDCWERRDWEISVNEDGTFSVSWLEPFPELPEDEEEAKKAMEEWYGKNNGFFETDYF
jgi:hypothetical protein